MRASSFFVAAYLAIQVASGATVISLTGTLISPTDASAEFTMILPTAGTLALQTWGFGGGTNAASQTIPPGGFDPFVGVFAGTGSTATFIDGTSDVLSSYATNQGCSLAGMVDIGGLVCGDVAMSFSLSAGSYTVLLTDGGYVPTAVFETNGVLGDGFTDLTGGAFQTCNTVGAVTTCITPTANWALDITAPSDAVLAPEPGGLGLYGTGLITLLAAVQRLKNNRLNA